MKRTLPLWGKHGGHDEQADYEEELRGRGAFLPPPRRPWWERWGKWLAVATVVGIPLGLLSLLAFC